MDKRPLALVTGATSGIGRAIAGLLAAGGHDLIVVARDGGALGELAGELDKVHGASCEVLMTDLSLRSGIHRAARGSRWAATSTCWSTAPAPAYVTSFTEALHEELRPHGVHVTALCPGLTPTGFQRRAGARRDGLPGFLWSEPGRWRPPVSAGSSGTRRCASRAGGPTRFAGSRLRLAGGIASVSARDRRRHEGELHVRDPRSGASDVPRHG